MPAWKKLIALHAPFEMKMGEKVYPAPDPVEPHS
jgi:hypothetical protein